jgi:hypothetical protein
MGSTCPATPWSDSISSGQNAPEMLCSVTARPIVAILSAKINVVLVLQAHMALMVLGW